MGTRIDLGDALKGILEELGLSKNVYFQPPASYKMSYPCIRYALSSESPFHANNKPYVVKKKYTITVIDKDPDSPIPDKVAMLPGCRFDRPYESNNLHHFVFTINY
jgi:hypothetical protein